MAVAVFVSQSSREGPLTAVTARGGRGYCPFPASGLMTRAAWPVPARDGGTGTHEPGSGPGEATPDQELVRRGQRGDLEAFDELMRRYVIRAYHVA